MKVKTKVTTVSGAVLLVLSSVALSSVAVAAAAETTASPSVRPLQDSRSSLVQAQPARQPQAQAHKQQQHGRAQAQHGKAQPARQLAGQQPAKTQAPLQPAQLKPAQPKPAAAPVVRAKSLVTLTLRENHLLSQDIDAWAKSQGLHPLWNSSRDYLIFSSIHLNGKNRDEVLNQLGQLFRSENYGLVIRLYEKNNVLVIDSQ